MLEEINAYEEYLLSFGEVEKPVMPKFDLSAYTDNEYVNAIKEEIVTYDCVDDEYLTLKYLSGN